MSNEEDQSGTTSSRFPAAAVDDEKPANSRSLQIKDAGTQVDAIDDVIERDKLNPSSCLIELAKRRPYSKCRACGNRMKAENTDIQVVDENAKSITESTPRVKYIHKCSQDDAQRDGSFRYNARDKKLHDTCINMSTISDNPSTNSKPASCREVEMICRVYDRPKLRRIESCSELRPGDEIAWHRGVLACCRKECGCPAIWHHAIVDEDDSDNDYNDADNKPMMPLCCCNCIQQHKRIPVIEYTPVKGKCCRVKIQRKSEYVDVDAQDVYIVDYVECYSNEYVLERAHSAARDAEGQHVKFKYSFVNSNCEHFARWAKTGVQESGQIWSICYMFLISLVMFTLRLTALIGLMAIEYLIPDDMVELESVEIMLSLEFVSLCLLIVGSYMIRRRCRQRRGVLLEYGFGWRCCRRCWKGRACCEKNCSLTVGHCVEIIVSWFIPMCFVCIIQHLCDGRRK